ncbi:MAG TPA: hypothetical protein VLG47_06095 [Candidatus Saccharimonadales bacterium]|nr:hypothetical protein [Candidatus Saccharimonadales bacterium]
MVVLVSVIIFDGLILINHYHLNWNSSSLQYEKLSYRYPKDWTRTNESIPFPKYKKYCTYPGEDYVTLKSPSGSQVVMLAGQACPDPLQSKIFASVPIKTFGKNMFVVMQAPLGLIKTTPTNATSACLARSSHPANVFDLPSRNVNTNHKAAGNNVASNSFCFIPAKPKKSKADKNSLPAFTPQQIESMQDFNTAKSIFETMHY